jgi:hypothetical protein
MSRLEAVDGGSWQDFAASPAAVLVLGKSDCEACASWSAELASFLERDERFAQVRFGKLLLDRPGLVSFKRANPWLAEVDVLPFNVIYVRGEPVKRFAGGGTERLVGRLERALAG